jgi:hypothetical protein
MTAEQLQLNDYELGYLTCFSHAMLEQFNSDDPFDGGEDDVWYGLTLDERVFDLNIWRDLDGSTSCSVFECVKNPSDEYETDTSKAHHLWKSNHYYPHILSGERL